VPPVLSVPPEAGFTPVPPVPPAAPEEGAPCVAETEEFPTVAAVPLKYVSDPGVPIEYAMLAPTDSFRLEPFAYPPPPPPPPSEVFVLPLPPGAMTSTELFALFQSAGTSQLVPLVRKMTLLAILTSLESCSHVQRKGRKLSHPDRSRSSGRPASGSHPKFNPNEAQ